ncbi:MAG: MFS transporter [Steroidobacteraceae bacterium]
MSRGLHFHLAQGYFWYFAAVGVFVPYWPPFLASIGFDPLQIGLLMGVFAGLRVFAPPLFAHVVDRSGRRLEWLRRAAEVSCLCALLMGWLHGFWAVALTLALFSAAWNSITSIYDAHVLDNLEDASADYGRLRLWGSIGFIVAVVVVGELVERVALAAVPWALAALIVVTRLSLRAGRNGEPVGPGRDGLPGVRSALADPRVWSFLLAAFLMLVSHGAYYNFFTIYLEQLGYSATATGLLWAWAVIAEIAVFMVARPLLQRFPLRFLMVTALAATALRWAVMATWPDSLGAVFAAQTLHLASFGIFHLCSVVIAGLLFPRTAASSGQALHGSGGFGAGALVGSVGSGWLWQHASPEVTFWISAGVAAVAALVALFGLAGLPGGPGLAHSPAGKH